MANKLYKTEEATASVNGMEVTYRLLGMDYPTPECLRGRFAQFAGDNIFVQKGIPEEYRDLVVKHEMDEYRYCKKKGLSERTRQAHIQAVRRGIRTARRNGDDYYAGFKDLMIGMLKDIVNELGSELTSRQRDDIRKEISLYGEEPWQQWKL